MELISILLFILLLGSLPLYLFVKYNKKLHETLIISIVFFVLILFLSGFFNNLNIGFLASIIISISLYVYSVYLIIKNKKSYKTFNISFNLISFGLVIICVYLIIGLKGKVFIDTDELSHWGDIVKTMIQTNKFGSDHNSGSLFKSYPPGIALFQYLLEKIHVSIFKTEFVEWLCYFSLDLICLSSVINCSKTGNTIKGFINTGLLFGSILIVPFILNDLAYITLYSELLIGFIVCGLLLNLINYKNDDIFYDIRILSLTAILFIVKDTGLLFGLITIIFYLFILFRNNKLNIKNILLTFSTSIPRIMWQLNLTVNNVRSNFDNKIDLKILINVFLGKDSSYRVDVLNAFKDEFLYTGLRFTPFRIFVNYILLTVIILVLTYVVIYLTKTSYKKVVFTYSVVSIALYVVSLLVMYLFKMSESEALMLASFYRYYSVIAYTFGLFVVIQFSNIISNLDRSIMLSVLMGIIILSMLPNLNPYVFIRRGFANASIEIRKNYDEIVNNTFLYADEESKIWFICIEGTGEDRLAYKFLVRPNKVDGDGSIRSEEDYDDISEIYSAEKWMNELIEKEYDFVAIYYYDDKFVEDYHSLFEKEGIKDNCMYKVNKETRMLSLCE